MTDIKKINMVIGNFIYPMDVALRILKAKYQDDIEDMFVDLPILKDKLGDFIYEVWNSVIPVTLFDLMDSKSSIFATTKLDNISDKRRSLFRFLPMSLMFENAEVVDERVITTKQFDETIDNVYRLKRVHVKDVFPEMREPTFNGKRITYMYAVEVTDTHTGKKYHLRVPPNESFTKSKKQYNAAEAVAWCAYTRIPINYIEGIYRQGESHTFKIKEECVGLPWHEEAYHFKAKDYFSLLKQQA